VATVAYTFKPAAKLAAIAMAKISLLVKESIFAGTKQKGREGGPFVKR
jgi:hypothetical protein